MLMTTDFRVDSTRASRCYLQVSCFSPCFFWVQLMDSSSLWMAPSHFSFSSILLPVHLHLTFFWSDLFQVQLVDRSSNFLSLSTGPLQFQFISAPINLISACSNNCGFWLGFKSLALPGEPGPACWAGCHGRMGQWEESSGYFDYLSTLTSSRLLTLSPMTSS